MSPAKLGAALSVINETLGLEAQVTVTGHEVKCHVPDSDGDGTEKRYLDRDDCVKLAAAFRTLAAAMVKA